MLRLFVNSWSRGSDVEEADKEALKRYRLNAGDRDRVEVVETLPAVGPDGSLCSAGLCSSPCGERARSPVRTVAPEPDRRRQSARYRRLPPAVVHRSLGQGALEQDRDQEGTTVALPQERHSESC